MKKNVLADKNKTSLNSSSLYSKLRKLHFYTAMPLAVLLLFLVISGLFSIHDKLNPAKGTLKELTTTVKLPADIPLERESVGTYLNELFPGKLDYVNAEDNETKIYLEIESVWRYHRITVNKADRSCDVVIEVYPTTQAMVDLHSAKKASRWQLIFFELLAVSLGVMILSGISLAFVRRQSKDRIIAMVLLLLGVVCLIVLTINR